MSTAIVEKKKPHAFTRFSSSQPEIAIHGRLLTLLAIGGLMAFAAAPLWAQENAAGQDTVTKPQSRSSQQDDAAAVDAAAQQARFEQLDQLLSGSTFVGRFSVDGEEGELKEERYEIADVTKLPGGDVWLFKTRIRYGDHDVTVPLPLPIRWAGNTPVIVVDQLNVPGLGVFDARVVIADDRYAGTWQHGDVGGHLFGRIERAQEKAADESSPATE